MKDALGLYLSQIGKIPLLTAAEEIQLSRQVQVGMTLEQDIPPSERTAEQSRIIRVGQRARRRKHLGRRWLQPIYLEVYPY